MDTIILFSIGIAALGYLCYRVWQKFTGIKAADSGTEGACQNTNCNCSDCGCSNDNRDKYS